MASELNIVDDGSLLELDSCSCVDLTTPLGHETLRSLIDVQELDSESGFVCPFEFVLF